MKQKETTMEKITRVVNVAGTAILMNLLFLVSCIPVVTIGQAWCALLNGIRYNIRGDSWFEGYKVGFKRRFWRGTISWCVMLLINGYFLLDLNHAVYYDATVPMVAAAVMFAVSGMLTVSLLMLNVYIPTSMGDWIMNSVNMVFKAPHWLLIAAALFWIPTVMALLWIDIFLYAVMVFIAVYFSAAALIGTMVMKAPLVDLLVRCRADGTLTAEEGSFVPREEDEE